MATRIQNTVGKFSEWRLNNPLTQSARRLCDRVASAIRAGKTLEQVVAAKPTADFDQGRMGGAITPDRFVTLVYTDLSRGVNKRSSPLS